MKYRVNGKEVLRDAEHVADCADPQWAQIIVDALNERQGRNAWAGDILAEPSPQRKPVHQVSRLIGGYSCKCGRRWDHDEGSDQCPGRDG